MRKALSAFIEWASNLKRTIVLGILAVTLITAFLGYFKYIYDDRAAMKAEVSDLKAQAKADAKQHNLIVDGLTDKAKDERTANEYEAPIQSGIARDAALSNRPVSVPVRNALIGLRDYEGKHVSDSD